jgi:hypothetical protein
VSSDVHLQPPPAPGTETGIEHAGSRNISG